MKKRFGMEIYDPGSRDTVNIFFESDDPLPVPRVGEFIAPVQTGKPGDLFEVTKVEHAYWNGPNGEPRHKAMVYTRKA